MIRNATALLVIWMGAGFGLVKGQSVNQPELLGEAVNSDYNEIGPVIAPDGKTLYFSRISHPQNANGENGSQDIWYTELRNNKWTNAVRMPNIVNKDVYNSIYSITPDGNTILLKGSYVKGVYQTRGFSVSKKVRRTWSVPETIEIPDYEKMSKGEFDCGFLSNDGKTLVMSFSDKKKGRNDDLYVSFKDKDGKWSKPQSLGPDLNTPGHMETTPFLAADGLTLYFSSDRPGGLGGNDIYSSRRLDASWRKWTKPVNLGPSVNTPGFEGYYTVAAAGDYAYWSSNNAGSTKKGDVFRLSLQKPKAPDSTGAATGQPVIAEQKDLTRPDPVTMLSGRVLDSKTGKPVEAMIVFNEFPSGREAGTATTDPETGAYKFTLPYGAKYTMRPVAPNFVAESELIDLTDAGVASARKKDLLLSSRAPELPDSSANAVPPVVVAANPAGKAGQDSTRRDTTGDGRVAKLDSVSKPRQQPVPAGNSDKTGTGDGKIAAVDTAQNRSYQEVDKTLKVVAIEVGGVVRLNNIFFETASARLRGESKMELDQMVQTMKEHPTMRVELGGHTDNEGSESTNLKLSQGRSNAVKAYLLQNGIAADRVTSVGYGESKPVAGNETAEGRQANRRVEFTIIQK